MLDDHVYEFNLIRGRSLTDKKSIEGAFRCVPVIPEDVLE